VLLLVSRFDANPEKNDYSWCTSNFIVSGWDQKVKAFTGYGIPIFLSEYGCIANPRNFGEIESLMHKNMTGVYSGGLMYEYSMEPNKFGIVEIKGGQDNGGKDQTGERTELSEFAAFAAALKKWPAPTGDGGYTSTSKASTCPTQDANWAADSVLPTMPAAAQKVRVLPFTPLHNMMANRRAVLHQRRWQGPRSGRCGLADVGRVGHDQRLRRQQHLKRHRRVQVEQRRHARHRSRPGQGAPDRLGCRRAVHARRCSCLVDVATVQLGG
jgi:hypothetical protein